MEKNVFVGVDVSKKTLDISSIQLRLDKKILNCRAAFNELLESLKKRIEADQELWIVFEHTGIYSQPLVIFCSENGVRFSQLPGLEIKKSLGIARGKNDRIDARRICNYAIEKSNKLKASPQADPKLDKLKRLLGLRDKLVIHRAGFETTVKELKEILELKYTSSEIKVQENLIKGLTKQITKIEKEMSTIIEEDKDLKKNKELLISIKGVGFIIALYVIVYTRNFTTFKTSRKFSCYCGTAPFSYDSGTSIRGKTKVHSLANKKLKSLMEMGARSAIQFDPEIKQYYLRRVEMGKNKTSTLNVVRNKLIGRMFAVINKQQPYEIKNAA